PVAPDPHNITLYAFQDGQRFCYKQHPNDPYREAPTIVAQNYPGYFDITLINRLPAPASGGHDMHMAAHAPPPQGNPPCPVLDTGPTPRRWRRPDRRARRRPRRAHFRRASS